MAPAGPTCRRTGRRPRSSRRSSRSGCSAARSPTVSTAPGPVSPVVLSLRGISKRFGTVQAVLGVDLECRAGEIHAVLGENGSGKSTLLGVAAGLLAPDEGEVEINGQPLPTASASEAQRLGLGIAYQTFSDVHE